MWVSWLSASQKVVYYLSLLTERTTAVTVLRLHVPVEVERGRNAAKDAAVIPAVKWGRERRDIAYNFFVHTPNNSGFE